MAKSGVVESVDECVTAARSALQGGHAMAEMHCPKCTAAQVTAVAPVDGTHVCSRCSHRWAGPRVASNPLAMLQPVLSPDGEVVFETNRPWELVTASKFAR